MRFVTYVWHDLHYMNLPYPTLPQLPRQETYTLFIYLQGFQQHDVQELNRILFSALESSLVGTPGEGLIKNLYHGTSVTKVSEP